MKTRQPKSEFAFYFPIFNTKGADLFLDDQAYRDIQQKVIKAKTLLRDLLDNQVYVADFYQGQFSVLREIPIQELKTGLQYIQSQLLSKKSLRLRSFLGWTYIPRPLRPTKNLLETISVGRDPSETFLVADVLLEQCETILRLKKIGKLWGTDTISFDSFVKEHEFLTLITYHAEEALRSYELGLQGVHYWASKLGLRDSYHLQ